jgi:hypothetical protein
MKTSIQNKGAKQVKEMVEQKESLNSILSFAKGYGFEINSYASHVNYINGKLSIKIRRENFYYYL